MMLRLRLICALVCAVMLAACTLCIASGIPIPGDLALVRLAVQARAPYLTLPIQGLTFISSSIPALCVTVAITLAEIWRRKRLEPGATWALTAYLGAVVCNIALRVAVGRLRPSVEYIPNVWPELQAGFQQIGRASCRERVSSPV